MFDTILIANRGEIACRVIKTARAMGIRTVAVYSEADANARHVRLADEAHLIGPAPARESYLRGDRLIAVAKRTGAKAIHPGYGFLSENAGFAEACAANDIVFIGPPVEAIRSMGLKDAAKAIMEQAGVPVVPGYHGENQDDDYLAEAADRIGYPVLIKAVAGGGGKGMRRVDSAADFADALAAARREAAGAFGDDRVLIEKFITKPRHIEIQVFADSQGNAVHLFERDCSLQRRHQKVVEEAPAPDMPDAVRAAMGQAAVTAAKAIGYEGAGTVEFIADVADGLRADGFYFMEMNTRLQVEHPVTEMITGQDLVEWQLRVAAGEPLPRAQDELAVRGHAVEVRLYAEDPGRGFLPATGRLLRLAFPEEDDNVRIDTGVEEGDEVSVHYDPMIAKVIAWDEDRGAALRRLSGALAATAVAGVTSNLSFLARCLAHPAFRAGDVDTGFIDRHLDTLVPAPAPASDRVLALAVLDHLLRLDERYREMAVRSGDPYSPWACADGWRLNGETDLLVRFEDGDKLHEVRVSLTREGYRLALPGGEMAVAGERLPGGDIAADLGGDRIRASVVRTGDEVYLMHRGETRKLRYYDPGVAADEVAGGAGTITAPMPGKVTKVVVKAGDAVRAGQPILVLEAMKMEHTLTAPGDGLVESLACSEGEQVEEGATLAVIKESDEA
ncbi:MAG: acetyl/propionyl/methylcrotonyl-CoA carboxylase subunit alpha [Alphaproteobacteria bacterium]|nr:MAG: acetyl/propionyl/methylcrotonyl-CoA carboxylase subunit alpha [Alphaproteobacteria bacterium]